MNKNSLRCVLPCRFQKVNSTDRVDIEIHKRNFRCLVVRRLRRAVDDRIKFVVAEKPEYIFTISDVEFRMFEILRGREQPIAIPCGVPRLAKKYTAHIVIYADYLVPSFVKKSDGL